MRLVRYTARLLAVTAAAALLLASAVATASARSLSSSEQNIRATWASLEFAGEALTVRCPLTLEGSFHARTLAKVVDTLSGAVTRVSIKEESCTNGRGRPKNFPWHIQYSGFTGVLPTINGVLLAISRLRFEVVVSGICTGEYGTETDKVGVSAAREAGGAITTISPIAGQNTVNRVAGTGFCPPQGRMNGSGNVTVLAGSSRITVTLI